MSLLWLIARCSTKVSCGHRWDFLEVAGSKVVAPGIKDVILGLIHDVMLGLRVLRTAHAKGG